MQKPEVPDPETKRGSPVLDPIAISNYTVYSLCEFVIGASVSVLLPYLVPTKSIITTVYKSEMK